MCSRRSSIHFTGRRSRLASSEHTISSGYIGCLMPKPPPTSGAMTCTWCSGTRSTSATPGAQVEVRLRRAVQHDSLVAVVPLGKAAAGLHRLARVPPHLEPQCPALRAGGHDVLERLRLDVAAQEPVVIPVLVDQGRAGRHRRVHGRHRRQRFVLDVDQLGSILGDVAVDGDHDGDRLTDEPHLVVRQRPVLGALPSGERGVVADGRPVLRRVGSREHGDDAIQRPRRQTCRFRRSGRAPRPCGRTRRGACRGSARRRRSGLVPRKRGSSRRLMAWPT